LINAHDFDRAVTFWTQRMRSEYPPDRFLYNRFADTDSIRVRSARTTSLNQAAGTATVAVDIIEVYNGNTRRWVGTWDLVRSSSGVWLLDDSHF
jgi:hypothetical protein